MGFAFRARGLGSLGPVALAVALGTCASRRVEAIQGRSLSELKRQARLPAWAAPLPSSPQEDRYWEPMNDARTGSEGMKRSARRLVYLVQARSTSGNFPFWFLKLGAILTELDCDGAAYGVLARAAALPPNTPHNGKIWGLKSLSDVTREAHFLQARILARFGLEKEAKHELDLVPPSMGYDHLRRAEVLALSGDAEAAEAGLTKACELGDGHPEKNWSKVMITVRATMLARAIERDDLALELSSWIRGQARDSQKWPQWKAAWSVVDKVAANIKSGKGSVSSGLKPGTYTGSCVGFVGPITVSLKTSAGKITSAAVVDCQEDRPWSAVEVVPQRVVRRQGLAVDAVTGATISSNAVLAAIDEALGKASK